MRRLLIITGTAMATLALASCTPAPTDPPKTDPPTEQLAVRQDPVLGLDIRYVGTDGTAKVLRVEDFPR